MKELENLEKRLADIQKEIETLKQGKPEFEKDCWYTGYDVIAKYSQLGDGNYGISLGIWSNDLNMSVPSAWRKSTPTEIQEALEKEAVKRGFVKGAKYKCLVTGCQCVLQGVAFDYDIDTDSLCATSGITDVLYRQGQWAKNYKRTASYDCGAHS